MKLNSESVLHKISGQASRVTRGEALVVLIEQRTLHRLNDVGTRVWELCDGRSLGEIAATISEEFEVEPAQAVSDVRAFAEHLLGLGALELRAREATA